MVITWVRVTRRIRATWRLAFYSLECLSPTPTQPRIWTPWLVHCSWNTLAHSRCAINISWMHYEWNWLVFLLSLERLRWRDSQPTKPILDLEASKMKPHIPVKAENHSCVSSIHYLSLPPTLSPLPPTCKGPFLSILSPNTSPPHDSPHPTGRTVRHHPASPCQELFSALLSLLVSGGDSSQCRKSLDEKQRHGRTLLSLYTLYIHFISSWISSIIKPWTSPTDLMPRHAAQLYLVPMQRDFLQ